jgi:Zn2+/Cd2+-exporting ATPase
VNEKKMLPVLGQPAQRPDTPTKHVDVCEDDCCFDGAKEALVANPATREPNPEAPDGALTKTVLRVEGMDCASCAVTVEKGVVRLPGVRRAAVNFAAGRLDAEHDPELAVGEIEKAVRDAGYGVAKTEDAKRVPFWRTPRSISVFASALLFALGLGLSVAGAPELARAGTFLAAIAVGGLPIFRAALAGVRARHLDMNVLMSAATLGAVGIGQWAEAASVVVLFAAGNALQVYAIDRTRGAVRALARLTPDEVLVKRGASEVLVAASEVWVGETVVVRPGERLAVDGVVLEGESAVDEASVTGESVPVEKGEGDGVYSGTLNGSGGLLVRATRRAGDSTLQRIVQLVEEAQARKAPAE